MKHRIRPSCSLLVIVSFLLVVTFPQSLSASSVEDNLKTAGIIMGITAGVALAVVLVAAIVMSIKKDDYGYLSEVSVLEPLELTFFDTSVLLWEGLPLVEPFSTQEGEVRSKGDVLLIGGSYLRPSSLLSRRIPPGLDLLPALQQHAHGTYALHRIVEHRE